MSDCCWTTCATYVLALWIGWVFARPCVRSSIKGWGVFVTGCDTGFGEAIAVHLDKAGAVVFAGCLTKEGAKRLEAKCSDKLVTVVLDVTKDDDVAAALKVVKSHESKTKLMAIVNNAGISAFGWAEELPLERYQKNMDVNFFGVVRVCKAFLPTIRANGGRVVNMGSISDRMPSAFGSSYISAKAAMACYSDCLRQEVHRFGVKVCLVEPGFFATALLSSGSANGAQESGPAPAAAGSSAAARSSSAYPSYEAQMKKSAEPIVQLEKLNGGPKGVLWVARVVEDAIATRFPKAKYVVGYDAMFVIRWLQYLPEVVVDLAQTYG
jgi:NAD(P)-dependent dehydrogenase (short-subunit alcohol dehydrogenase family)